MKLLDTVKNLKPKDGLTLLLAIGTGIAATVGAIKDSQKEEEFEAMKKAISELQKK